MIGYPAAQRYLGYISLVQGEQQAAAELHLRGTDTDHVAEVQSLLAPTANPEAPDEVDVSQPSDVLAARAAAAGAFDSLFSGSGWWLDRRCRRIANIMIISVLERRSESASVAPSARRRPDPDAVPRRVDPARAHRRCGRRARRRRGNGCLRRLEELGRRDPRRGVVGRHRLGHPDRRVRRPDAGRPSVSDAADRGIANGMSSKLPRFRIAPGSWPAGRKGCSISDVRSSPGQPHASMSASRQRRMVTGTPGAIRAASQRMLRLERRTHPWDTAVPSVPPMFPTPCMAVAPGPPPNSCNTLERALSASANGAPRYREHGDALFHEDRPRGSVSTDGPRSPRRSGQADPGGRRQPEGRTSDDEMPARRRQHGLALRDPTVFPLGAQELDPQPPHAVRGRAADDGEDRRPTRDGSPRGHHAHPRCARAGAEKTLWDASSPASSWAAGGTGGWRASARVAVPPAAAATTTPVRSISRGRSSRRVPDRLSDALGRPPS